MHEKFAHDKTLPRFAGWWGNDPDTRFKMPRTFVPAVGARSWQLSNAPVLGMAALKASLDIFQEAGMERLHKKSIKLTGFLEKIIDEINAKKIEAGKPKPIKIITPHNSAERGCQLSLVLEEKGKEVYQKLMEAGIIIDWREPDVIRVAPVPLYNTFTDVYRFGKLLQELV